MGKDGVAPPEPEGNRFTVCPATIYGIFPHVRFPLGLSLPPRVYINYGRFSAGVLILCKESATLTSSGSYPDTRQRQGSNPQAIFSMAHLFSRQRRYNHFGTLAKCTRRKLHPLFNLKNCNLLQLVAILFLLRTYAQIRKEETSTNNMKRAGQTALHAIHPAPSGLQQTQLFAIPY